MSKPQDLSDQPGLEVGVGPTKYYQYSGQPGMEVGSPPVYHKIDAPYEESSPRSSRIWGLPARTFWTVFAIVVVVILGAGIGGGVGGGIAAASKKPVVSSGAEQQSSSSSSHSATPAATASSSSSSSASTTASSSYSSASASSTVVSAVAPFSTSDGQYRIINIQTDTAIDLFNGISDNATQVTSWSWNPTALSSTLFPHQNWQISSAGNDAINIVNVATNSYLAASANLVSGINPDDNPYAAQVFGENPGDSESALQQWKIVANADNSISFSSVAYPTKVLDIFRSNTSDGTPIILWEPNAGVNQRWRLLAS